MVCTPCPLQVKKKMTSDEFVRNNRGINNGQDLPQDFLRDLFVSINRNEIRITTDASDSDSGIGSMLWLELQQQASKTRGQMAVVAPPGGLLCCHAGMGWRQQVEVPDI